MNKFQAVALAIKDGDINRKNYFKEKIKNELKKYLQEPTDEQLERLLMEATNEFINKNIESSYLFYCQSYILTKLEKINNIHFEANDLFTKQEMIIMTLYLNDEIILKEAIAKKLGISPFDVNNTIYKAKNYYSENRNQITDLFPNFKKTIEKKEKLNNIIKNKKNIKRKDIELLGYFTGQINNICLDIEELAEQNFTSKEEMEKNLAKIFISLKDNNIYSYILREFPYIEEMLIIKAKYLNLTPKDFLPKDVAAKYKELEKQKTKNKKLERTSPPKDKKEKDSTNSVNLNVTKEPSNVKINRNKQKYSKKAKLYADFLRDVYQKKEDNTYRTISELAEKHNIHKQTVFFRKKNFIENLEKNKQLQEEVLNEYPTLYTDKEIYIKNINENKDEFNLLDDIDSVVTFCKNIFQTKINDNFLSYKSLARLYNIDYSLFIKEKKAIFKLLEKDKSFLTKILNKYPQLLKEKQIYEADSNKIQFYPERIEEYVAILKNYYEENNDGSYNRLIDVANIDNSTLSNINAKKRKILNLINTDNNIKQQTLNLYPTLFEDIAIKKAVISHKKNKINTIDNQLAKNIAERYSKFLKNIYQEEENHIPLKFHLTSLNCTMTEFLKKIKKILNIIKNEKEVRKFFNKLYPLFNEDMEKYMKKENNYTRINLEVKKAPQYAKFLKILLKKNNNGNYSPNSILLNIIKELNFRNLISAKNTIFREIDNNKNLQAEIIKLYPTYLKDKKEYEDYLETLNQLTTNEKKTSTKKTNNSKISDLEFLKLILKKKKDNKYYTNKDLTSLLGYSNSAISLKRIKLLEKLNNDEKFRNYIIKNYEEVLEDLQVYKKESQYEIPIEVQYSEFLKLIYQKKEDGTYRSTEELLEILNLNYNNFHTKKSTLLKKLDLNQELKNKIINIYPSLIEDIKNYKNFESTTLNEKETEVAELLLTDKTRKIITYREMAKDLNTTPSYLLTLENNALFKISHNPNLEKDYPTAKIEHTIRSKAPRKAISISQKDLEAIRINSQKLENNNVNENSKNALLEGIKALEKSIYKDYVSLCDYKHKAMLTLRLGFFNRTIFSNEDVAKLFEVSKEEVELITSECLKLCISDKDNKIKNLNKKL